MKKSKRLEVYEKCNHRCAYCGTEIDYTDMQVDHIKPAVYYRYYKQSLKRAKSYADGDILKNVYEKDAEAWKIRISRDFGSLEAVDAIENLLPACRDCNYYKTCQDLERFREYMKKLHTRMKYKSPLKLRLFEKYKVSEGVAWDGVFYFETLKESGEIF